MKKYILNFIIFIFFVSIQKINSQLIVSNIQEEMRVTARNIKNITQRISKIVRVPSRIIRLSKSIEHQFITTNKALQEYEKAMTEISRLKNLAIELNNDNLNKDIEIILDNMNLTADIIESNANFISSATEELYDIIVTVVEPFVLADDANTNEIADKQLELLIAQKEAALEEKKMSQFDMKARLLKDREKIQKEKEKIEGEKKAKKMLKDLEKTGYFNNPLKKQNYIDLKKSAK